jgi:predicted transcriptional regulator
MPYKKTDLVTVVSDLVAAYVGNNSVRPTDVPDLIMRVHEAVTRIDQGEIIEPVQPPVPAVPLRKSVTSTYIVCLEDGRKFKSLRRHLKARYGMTPDEYRAKWGLPANYPMVAPDYAQARSKLAKEIGLGRKRRINSPLRRRTK